MTNREARHTPRIGRDTSSLQEHVHRQTLRDSLTDTRTQAEKFEAAARELGCDPEEDRFKGVLRKPAKPKS